MAGLVKWFVHNPIAANLLMLLIICMGLLSFPMLPKQFFPERELDLINVTVIYPGAGPSEVEQQICIRLENALHDLDGVDKMRCTALEGSGSMSLEVAGDYDSLRLLNAVKGRVDAITTFPEQAERPEVKELLWRSWMMSLVVAGAIGEANLKELGLQLRDELAAMPGIQVVAIGHERAYELAIEVAETSLRRYGLDFDEVVAEVRGASLNVPAGKLTTDDGDIQVQVRGQAYDALEFEDITLLRSDDGSRVRLGDVATVVDGFEEMDLLAEFDGDPFIELNVYGVTRPDILLTRAAVGDFVERLNGRLPPGMQVAIWRDQSVSFKGRLDTLLRNGFWGLVLVFVILLLFLRPLLAFWVVVGIAIAFLGAVWMLPLTGVSLNVISIFAFILILGIVVDDAIIVGESVYRYQARGMEGTDAAVKGTLSVLKPVCVAVLTTMLFFGSFQLLPDSAPAAKEISWVVLIALTFSLFECLLILPAHLAHMKPERPGRWPPLAMLERTRERLARGLERFAERYYRPLLERSMAHRGLTLLVFIVVLSLTVSVYAGGWISTSFFPKVTANYLIAKVSLAEGVPFAEVQRVKTRLDQAALRLQGEVNSAAEVPLIEHVRSLAKGSEVTVALALGAKESRTVTAQVLKQRWQRYIGELPQVEDFTIQYTIGGAVKDIELLLEAADITTLRAAAAVVGAELAAYPGVYNVRDSLEAPQAEIELVLKPLAETLDISLADLARQVRQGFYGEEVQRIPRQREDVKVMVRYPKSEREAVDFLQNMRVRTPTGAEVPFDTVAQITYVPGFRKIERVDRRRTSLVSAELEPGYAGSAVVASIMEQRLPQWRARFPGFDIRLQGKQHDRAEFLSQLWRLLLGTLLVVFGLMAIIFRSYWQPILILVAIPFGYMGAIIGHLVFDRQISMFSFLGMIACAGVVINDNLVLIDRVNQLRQRGAALADALLQGAQDRFRPIVLTSLTTFVGLLPITLERSTQAQFLIPMVISLTFGVLIASTVTLIFVPCLYLQIEHGFAYLKQLRRQPGDARNSRSA